MGELRSIHNGHGERLIRKFTGRQTGTSEEFAHMQPQPGNVDSLLIRHRHGFLKDAPTPQAETSEESNVVEFRTPPPPPDPKLA